jgi:MFS family permease
MQIVGIVFGMITLGYLGDKIGRKWGSVFTVSIMMVGCILLATTGAGLSGRQMVIMYIVSQFVFGYGVGGEYPMAAGSAAERAEAGGKKAAAKRGREVVLTFSMQGLGNFINIAVLLILFACFDTIHPIHGVKPKAYHPHRLEGVWRTSFALGAIPLAFMIYYRIFRLRESAVWVKRKDSDRGADTALLFKHYWHRLFATCGGWFLWDFSFYGNKVFQSTFIGILSPGASIFVNLCWTLLNSGVALIGYYLAATVVDNRYIGRLRLQAFGFLMVAVLFYVAAIWYHPLTSKGGITTFQFVYFFSSFWGQFGPNCTTFLLAGELYPTEVRTTAHGISAGVAKLGALWAAVWFNYLNNNKRLQFWLTASFNIGGLVLTMLFMPDPLRVSLTEVDRRWNYIREGKVYHGEAINPINLSFYERWTGVGKTYDRAKDEEDRYQDGYANKKAPVQGKTKQTELV